MIERLPPPAAPCLTDRSEVDTAATLIAGFGSDAGFEAANRAERSRDLGNAVGFARWRSVERLIMFLASDEAQGTRH
ncbi:hypothetical protein [Sphingomonas sp. RS2018]